MPKYCTINGIWALKPYYEGPWTLRDRNDLQDLGLAILGLGIMFIMVSGQGLGL